MMGQVELVDEAFQYRTPFEVKFGDKFKEANFAYFDVNSLVSPCDSSALHFRRLLKCHS